MNTTTWLCGSPPANGQRQRYPSRFEFNLRKTYPQFYVTNCLHMFSGSTHPTFWMTTTDMRHDAAPNVASSFDALPFGDESFEAVMADPPYADHYQKQWGGDLPKPKSILREAVRLVKPGGLIGILHIIIIPAYKELGVKRIALHPILAGPNNAIRVFNVFQKRPQ